MGILDDLDQELSAEIKKEKVSYEKPKKGTSINFIGVILLLALTVFGSFYVIKTKPEILGLSKDINAENQKEITKYVKEVGELMLLPDETPQLATVNDIEKVREQSAFYKNAKEGDKVLVYVEAKKAILYRPSEKKIIEVGTVTTSQPDSQNSNIQVLQTSPTVTPSVSAPSPTSGAQIPKTTLTPTTGQE